MTLPDNMLETKEKSSRRTQLAREAFGMWSDRDPDEYLAHSRAGLALRDQEGEEARRMLARDCQIPALHGTIGA